MNDFLKRNKNKKIVILDVPLLLENKIDNKTDILIFIDSKNSDINKRLKKRENFNYQLYNKFKKIQFSIDYKKRKSHFIIKNKFTYKSMKKSIRSILNNIL